MHIGRQPDLAVLTAARLSAHGFLTGLDGVLRDGLETIQVEASRLGLTADQAQSLSATVLAELVFLLRTALDSDRLAHDRAYSGPAAEVHAVWAKARISQAQLKGPALEYELQYLQLINEALQND